MGKHPWGAGDVRVRQHMNDFYTAVDLARNRACICSLLCQVLSHVA